jgi:hypothetical protein
VGAFCHEARPKCDNALFAKEGFVTDFFTRETWRAGKKSRLRKRRKPYGGRKTAPAAFLEPAVLAVPDLALVINAEGPLDQPRNVVAPERAAWGALDRKRGDAKIPEGMGVISHWRLVEAGQKQPVGA